MMVAAMGTTITARSAFLVAFADLGRDSTCKKPRLILDSRVVDVRMVYTDDILFPEPLTGVQCYRSISRV
jgi:hypothetical protein